MKNWKCVLGLHNYKHIITQSVPGVVGGFSMVQLQREVKKCDDCNKIKFIGFDIATNAHNDNTLNWQPELKL